MAVLTMLTMCFRGQDGFVVDDGLRAIAVGIEAKVAVHQCLAAAGAVVEVGEAVGIVVVVGGGIEAVELNSRLTPILLPQFFYRD